MFAYNTHTNIYRNFHCCVQVPPNAAANAGQPAPDAVGQKPTAADATAAGTKQTKLCGLTYSQEINHGSISLHIPIGNSSVLVMAFDTHSQLLYIL